MFTLVGLTTKMESRLSPALLVDLAENDLEIIQIIVGHCPAVNLAL